MKVETLSFILDKLIGECIKIHAFERLKAEEHSRKKPDGRKIGEWDRGSRVAVENRRYWKQAFDEKIEETVKDIAAGTYRPPKERRSFDK